MSARSLYQSKTKCGPSSSSPPPQKNTYLRTSTKLFNNMWSCAIEPKHVIHQYKGYWVLVCDTLCVFFAPIVQIISSLAYATLKAKTDPLDPKHRLRVAHFWCTSSFDPPGAKRPNLFYVSHNTFLCVCVFSLYRSDCFRKCCLIGFQNLIELLTYR